MSRAQITAPAAVADVASVQGAGRVKRWGVIFRVIGGVRATPRHWVEAFEAALVIGLTVLVVNALAVSSVGMWQSWNIGGWLTRIGILLSAGALVSSVYWVARRGPRKQVGLVVGGLCLSGQLMSSAQDPSLATIPGGWWGYSMPSRLGC